MLNSMDITTNQSEEISNLKNFNSSFKEGQIVELSTDGQFVIIRMEGSEELYAVPCSKDISEQDIFKKLINDGFLVEETGKENLNNGFVSN